MTAKRYVAFAAILAIGVLLRSWDLAATPLWADEAESSVNALTILEHGYPTSFYLGKPIFENTLIEPWPEHPEFEFRDSSYSKRGVAVYHGWFPLYSIAASFAIAGVRPDTDLSRLTPRHSPADWRRRTIAARVPSILLGVALMVTLFVAGRALAGESTAWPALVLTAILPAIVDSNRQARYYSAALLFSALSGFLVWQISNRGQWRWFVGGACAFVLLFHSHLILFAAACLLFAVRLPAILHIPRYRIKLTVFSAIVFLGSIPWAFATGFFESASGIPKTYHLLRVADIFRYPLHNWPYTALIGAGFAAIVARRWLHVKAAKAVSECQRPYLFVLTWLAISYCTFIFLIPAASFFANRLPIVAGPPGILLVAMVFATIARVIRAKPSPAIATALGAAFVVAPGYGLPARSQDTRLSRFVARIQEMRLQPDTRLYAMPNNHLVLTFYTGLPFESTAPVRKSFFDRYPGRILIAEPLFEELEIHDPVAPGPLLEAGLAAGSNLTESSAARLSSELASFDYRRAQAPRVCSVSPAPVESALPAFAAGALEQQRVINRMRFEGLRRFADSMPMTRGFPVHSVNDAWCLFFYRFVDPLRRMGPNLNYAGRVKSATLSAAGDGWVLYDIPPKDTACAPE